MTTPRFQPRNGVLIGAAALLTACTPPGGLRNFDGDPWVKRNAEALDRMAARLNEYGTVGMSAPLIMTPDPNFEFSVKKGPEEYFNDAKTEIQARAAAVEQEVSLFGLNASASIDPTQMAKYGEALKTYQDERIDYLRQRTERDRALNAATAASNAATRLRRDAMLKAAEQIEDPQQRAEAQAKALDDYATALTANAGNAPQTPTYPTPDKPTAQGAQGEASRGRPRRRPSFPRATRNSSSPASSSAHSRPSPPPTAPPSSWRPATPRWRASCAPCKARKTLLRCWASTSCSPRRWCRSRQAGVPARTSPPG